MKIGGKVSLTKLLSRLSHKVCCLLSSPVLLRKPTTVQWIMQLNSDLFDCVTCFYGFSHSILATRVSSLDLGHVYSCCFFFTPSGKVVGSGDDMLLDPVPTGYLNARIRPGGPNRSLHDQNFPSVS